MEGNKQFWGPAIWKTIHSLAVAYTPDQKEQYKAYIYNLVHLLPCRMCRNHLKENLKRLPIDSYLTDNNRLFLWTYFLHDIVNKQLGKTSPTFEDIKRIYYNNMNIQCASCK